jgi:hypothetical protein
MHARLHIMNLVVYIHVDNQITHLDYVDTVPEFFAIFEKEICWGVSTVLIWLRSIDLWQAVVGMIMNHRVV